MYVESISRNATAIPQSADRSVYEHRRAHQVYFRRRVGISHDANDVFHNFGLKVMRSSRSLRDDKKIDA